MGSTDGYKMKSLLFSLIFCLTLNGVHGIYGGLMSYSSSPVNESGYIEVKLYFLNGWELQGAYFNCTENDEGSDVTARRKQYIMDTHMPNAFGKWSFEVENKGEQNIKPKDITFDVNNNIRDIVLMVNTHEGWAWQSSEINLVLGLNTSEKSRFDIMFRNHYDERLTDMGQGVEVFLQVKVDLYNRSDTMKPNNGPVVIAKPYYSLELGKTHTIHIPTIDIDDDATHCVFSIYLEAGGLMDLVRNLTGSGIAVMEERDCVLTINLDNARFHIGDTFALPVTIKEYSRRDFVSSFHHLAYESIIGRVVLLMFFKVTGRTDPPIFISPTPPNNQEYTVYLGGYFHVSVYAKPTDSARRIRKIKFLRHDGLYVNQTEVKLVSWDPNAAYSSMSWTPLSSDIGMHIVCANAEDSDGISIVDLHCFKITVKANIYRPNPSTLGKPYFSTFPKPYDIVCRTGSYCFFPVHAATDNSGGIKSINNTDKTVEYVHIQYIGDIRNGTQDIKEAQVEVLALTSGLRQICLNSSDSYAWTVRCLYISVQEEDPCEPLPCQNGGRCTYFKNKSGFVCICSAHYEGLLCEKSINNCPGPCVNSTNCIQIDFPPFFVCIQCQRGKRGEQCDIDVDVCNPSPCNGNDICQQINSSFTCLSGDVEQKCTQGCLNNQTSVCVKNQCICSLGDRGEECLAKDDIGQANNTNPHFVSPTSTIGSSIICSFNERKCRFPVYILSEAVPKLSFFNGTNGWKKSGRTVSFTALKNESNLVYQATVVLTKMYNLYPEYIEYEICLNVAELTSPQNVTDKGCFHVVDKGIPLGERMMSQLYPRCHFAIPTIPRDSIVGCKRGQPCHFYLYAETYNGACPNMTSHDPFTGMFSPEIFSGLCRYEVAYTNTTVSGTNTICFMVCSKGESRCFQMYTNDMHDRCASNPCLNNAYCQIDSSGNYQCHCLEGFWGRHCENGFCYNQSYCQNDATCFLSNGKTGCICRLGFSGKNCDIETHKKPDITENGSHFTQQNVIVTMHCYTSVPCLVPISITRNVHYMPKIEVGFVDKALEVQSIDLDLNADAGGIVSGILKVVGHELGLKMICLDSVAQPKTAKIEDEICFKINFSLGYELEADQFLPHFVDPTLPTSTVLQCIVKENCYVTLWTKNQLGEEKCPQLEVDKTIEDGVYIFPHRDTAYQPCIVESVIFIDNVTDLQLCFSLPSDTVSSKKDQRCYTVRVLPKLTVKGSCAGVLCSNGGFCDGSLSIPRCLCRSGFSGDDCSKKLTTFPPDYGQPRFISPSPINGTLFPCTTGQPCHVVLAVKKEYNNVNCPVVKNEYVNDSPVHVFVSNFSTECRYDIRIESSVVDDQTTKMYCFKCPNFGILAETRCFKVHFESQDLTVTKYSPSSVAATLAPTVQDTTTGSLMTSSGEILTIVSPQGRPYFLHLPQNENLVCVQDQICNFSVYASTTFCRDITNIENMASSQENVKIYTVTKTVGMTVAKTGDVQFLPRQTGRRRICLKAYDCISSTQKCFYITVLKNNPCESSPCQHRGQCLALNAKKEFTCSCRHGYTGKLCETKIRPCMSNDTCLEGSTCVPVSSEPYFRCICPPGRTGLRCDVDAGYEENCKNSSLCRNNAACHSVNETVSCVCRLGYKGLTCSKEANHDLMSPTNTGAKFTDTALPKSVICYVAFPCPIPFTVTKNIFNKPRVALGYFDPLLHVTSLELEHTTSFGGVVHGVLEVVGNTPGSASICVKSIDKSWQVKVEDEICFRVEVKKGNYYKKYMDVPHFVKPTFETDGLFECLIGDHCHLNLWAEKDSRGGNCPVLKSESGNSLDIFIMPPLNQTLSPCMYDVSIKADTQTNATICFYLEGDEGVKLERRCYTIEMSNLIQKGSCTDGVCYNGGFCDGHTPIKTCICTLGFSGENCTTDHGIPQAVNRHTIHNPLFGNMLLPKQVICPLNKTCSLQLLVLSRKGFNINVHADTSSIEIKEMEEIRVSEDVLVTLAVVHNRTGSHQLCLNLTSESHSLITDRFCCEIFTKKTVTPNSGACDSDSVDDCRDPTALQFICSDPTTAEYCRKSCKLCDDQTKEEKEQLFIPPSPTNTSAFSCSPGLECHMMLYLKRGYNNLCPEVSVIPSVGASVHVFNQSDCDVCSVDVRVKLSLSHPGERLQQCLQATDDDFGSKERRCYFLENVQHISP